MKVIANKILVLNKVEDNKEVSSKGGILLQEKVDRNAPLTAEVVVVGSDVKDVYVGDTIMFGSYAGTVFNKDDISYRLLEERDILCIL